MPEAEDRSDQRVAAGVAVAARRGPTLVWRLATSRGVQLIGAVVLLSWMLYGGLDAAGGPEVLRARFGLTAVAILVPVQALVAVSPFPSEVLVVANSAVYGFWLGALMAWIGWMLAAFLQYALARRTARDFDFEAVFQRLPRRLRHLPVDHPAFLICVRWLPWGPHLVNSAAGVFGVPLWRHGWCAAVAIAPVALFIFGVATGLVRFWGG